MSQWQKNSDVSHCNSCGKLFSVFVRQHHCRSCGWLFCDRCSEEKLLIPRKIYKPNPSRFVIFKEDCANPARCCDDCAYQLSNSQKQLKSEVSPCNKSINSDEVKVYLPFFSSMSHEIKRATDILEKFREARNSPESHVIPSDIFYRAQGLIFLTIIKGSAGVISVSGGSGVMMLRQPDGGWSAPAAVSVTGLGYGFQFGAAKLDAVMIVEDAHTIRSLIEGGSSASVLPSASAGLSVGLQGIHAGGAVSLSLAASPIRCYALSCGVYVGLSVDASVLHFRQDLNANFYGEVLKPAQILSSTFPRPRAALPLYVAISQYMVEDSGLPARWSESGGFSVVAPWNISDDEQKEDDDTATTYFPVMSERLPHSHTSVDVAQAAPPVQKSPEASPDVSPNPGMLQSSSPSVTSPTPLSTTSSKYSEDEYILCEDRGSILVVSTKELSLYSSSVAEDDDFEEIIIEDEMTI